MTTPSSSREDALAWVSTHAASLNDSAADADLMIEAVYEYIGVKQAVFSQLVFFFKQKAAYEITR